MTLHFHPASEAVLHVVMADCENEESVQERLARVLGQCRIAGVRGLILESRVQGCAIPCLGVVTPERTGLHLFEAGITRLATVCEHGTFAYASLLADYRAAGGNHRGFFCAQAARDWFART